MGEATGMCEKLLTSTTSGVRSSEKEERQEKFGRNYVEPPPLTPFWRFCLDALEDPTLQFLIVAAIVSLLVGSIFEAKCLGYLDGIAILVAVWVVVFVGAAQEAGKQVHPPSKLHASIPHTHHANLRIVCRSAWGISTAAVAVGGGCGWWCLSAPRQKRARRGSLLPPLYSPVKRPVKRSYPSKK